MNGHDLTRLSFLQAVAITGNSDCPEFLAWNKHQSDAYPTYLIESVTKEYGEVDIEIEYSKHNRYKKEFQEHPEWFISKEKIRERKLKTILE